MALQALHEGQTDFRLNIKVDYDNGTQMTEYELSSAQELKVEYLWRKRDADNVSGEWTASGYYMSGSAPYIYYEFSGDDAVPDDAAGFLIGRAVITDENGRVSKGKIFEIEVNSDSLE